MIMALKQILVRTCLLTCVLLSGRHCSELNMAWHWHGYTLYWVPSVLPLWRCETMSFGKRVYKTEKIEWIELNTELKWMAGWLQQWRRCQLLPTPVITDSSHSLHLPTVERRHARAFRLPCRHQKYQQRSMPRSLVVNRCPFSIVHW